MNAMKAGFDVGGVIYPKSNTEGADPNTLPNEEIIVLMKQLKNEGNTLFIISYLGKAKAQSTMDWLKRNNIVPDLVPVNNVFFVGEDKRVKVVVAKYLSLNRFYDDSIEIINALKNGVPDDDKKKKKEWKKLKGRIGDGEWGRMDTFIPSWETHFTGGFDGEAVLYETRFV